MNELKTKDFQGRKVIDSRDVAKMVGRSHNELLKSIRTYCGYLDEGEIPQIDFFVSSTYRDNQNRDYPNFLITRKGCDMIANKLTGKKGVLFTAAYVTAFEEMNERLNRPPAIPAVSPSGLADLIRITRRIMLDMGSTPQDVGQMAQSIFQSWNVPVPASLTKQLPGQVSLFDYPALEN